MRVYHKIYAFFILTLLFKSTSDIYFMPFTDFLSYCPVLLENNLEIINLARKGVWYFSF